MKQLKSADARDRAKAARALARVGSAGADAVRALARRLDDPSPEVRDSAMWALAHLNDRQAAPFKGLWDTPALPVYQTKPFYPSDAYDKKIEGVVIVDFLISARGEVTIAEVSQSVAGLDQAALDAVRLWRFEAARYAGKAVPCFVQTPVSFRID